MSDTQWHYLKDDQQYGPITEAELVELFKSSILGPLTFVWNPQFDDWKKAQDVPDLVAKIESPETGLPPWVQPASYNQRPTSVTVFGILNIIFGSIGILGAPSALLMLFIPIQGMELTVIAKTWIIISMAVGLVMAIVELTSGIGLLRQKQSGRKLALTYGIMALIWALIGIAVSVVLAATNQYGVEQQEAPGFICGNIASLIVLIYPILLIIFMRKPDVIQACDK